MNFHCLLLLMPFYPIHTKLVNLFLLEVILSTLCQLFGLALQRYITPASFCMFRQVLLKIRDLLQTLVSVQCEESHLHKFPELDDSSRQTRRLNFVLSKFLFNHYFVVPNCFRISACAMSGCAYCHSTDAHSKR